MKHIKHGKSYSFLDDLVHRPTQPTKLDSVIDVAGVVVDLVCVQHSGNMVDASDFVCGTYMDTYIWTYMPPYIHEKYFAYVAYLSDLVA